MRRQSAIAMFVLVASVAALPALWSQFTRDKLDLHAALNAWHTPWADVLFANFTHLADGWTPVIVALLLLFLHSWRACLMVGLSCGVSALVTQFLKRVVFDGHHRPSMFADELAGMAWVGGVDLHAHFSFPSGHTTAAFSMCLALAVVAGRTGLAAVLALAAIALGFSRIYLSQHFLEDVLAGAAIGTITATGMYVLLYRSRWAGATWLDRRPLRAA